MKPGVKFKLTFTDKDLMRRLNKVEKSIRSDAAKGLRAAQNYLIANIKTYYIDNSGLHVDTGNLINSITEDEIQLGKTSWITFGPHAVYAAIHEFGGVIRATHAPYLVFMIDGNLIRTKSVTIPARPYIRPVIDRDGDEALALLGKTIGSIINGEWS